MLKSRSTRFAIAVILVITALILGASGCQQLVPGMVSQKDTSITTVRSRDTIVYTVSDSARIIALVKDIRSWREFIEELARRPLQARGAHNARVQLTSRGDSLIVTGNCDSLEHRFQDALRTIETLKSSDRTEVVQLKNERDTIPGWMRGLSRNIYGLSLLSVVLTACIIALRIYLFKRF